MKLIKIAQDHYIIVDDSEIKMDDWYLDDANKARRAITEVESYWTHRKHYKKITHSTQPLEWFGGEIIFLSEVKKLIGEVDVEKKAYEYAINDFDDYAFCGYVKGYNQALEDNKEKKYTEEDLRKAYYYGKSMMTPQNFEKFIKSLQPKTEWDVEFVEGKLKLK